MITRLKAWLERTAGWLLSLYVKHVQRDVDKQVKKHMDETNTLPTAIHIPVIGNVPFDVFKDIATNIVPAITKGMKDNKSAEAIWADVKKAAAPTLFSTAEAIIGLLFPEVGTILGLLTFLINNSKTMTQEETNAWMDRQGAGSQS